MTLTDQPALEMSDQDKCMLYAFIALNRQEIIMRSERLSVDGRLIHERGDFQQGRSSESKLECELSVPTDGVVRCGAPAPPIR